MALNIISATSSGVIVGDPSMSCVNNSFHFSTVLSCISLKSSRYSAFTLVAFGLFDMSLGLWTLIALKIDKKNQNKS